MSHLTYTTTTAPATYAQACHELEALTRDYHAGNMTYAQYTARYDAIRAPWATR